MRERKDMAGRLAQATDGVTQAGWREIVSILLLRLVVVICFVVVLAFLLPGDRIACYAFIAIAYVASIPYALWMKNRARSARVLPLQCVVDLLLVTGLVYFTGGMDSDLALLYPLVILSAGVLAGSTLAVQIAVLSSLVYALLVVLIEGGVLKPFGAVERAADWGAIIEVMGVRIFIFIAFGLASSYLSRRCHYANIRVEQFRKLADIIFRNARAGLMLVDRSGHIKMANERACQLLGHSESSLIGRDIRQLVEDSSGLDLEGDHIDCDMVRFVRPDGDGFPARLEGSLVRLGAGVLPGAEEGEEVFLVALSDITHLVEAQDKAKYADRMQAAARMASEIAHEIRNPLAAISGSVQLLAKLDHEAAAGNRESALLLADKKEVLYEQVVGESVRMDRIIQRFLDHAEFSPAALSRLIDLQEQLEKPGEATGEGPPG